MAQMRHLRSFHTVCHSPSSSYFLHRTISVINSLNVFRGRCILIYKYTVWIRYGCYANTACLVFNTTTADSFDVLVYYTMVGRVSGSLMVLIRVGALCYVFLIGLSVLIVLVVLFSSGCQIRKWLVCALNIVFFTVIKLYLHPFPVMFQ